MSLLMLFVLGTACTRDVAGYAWVDKNTTRHYAASDLPERHEPLITRRPRGEPPRVTSQVTVMLKDGGEVTHHPARALRSDTSIIVDHGPQWPPLRTYALDEVRLVRVDDVKRERVERTRRVIEPAETTLVIAGVALGMVFLTLAVQPTFD